MLSSISVCNTLAELTPRMLSISMRVTGLLEGDDGEDFKAGWREAHLARGLVVLAQPRPVFLARGELIAAGQFDDFDPVSGRFVLGVERVDGLANIAAVVPGEQIDEATRGHRPQVPSAGWTQ